MLRQITSLVAEIAGAVTAAAFMELTARVTNTENVDGSTTLAGLAQWLVKTTVGDLVAGVGLYNDGMTSRFTVMADRFMILPSDAQDDEDARIPFAVVNGEVFINEAVIREASIGVAKIENGFLENLTAVHGTLEFARIAKGDIFDLTISNIIQSVNYDPGVAGWGIRRDGSFEVNGGVFRSTIASADFQQGIAGWIIRRDGTAEFDAGAIRGTLSAEHIDSDVQNTVVLARNSSGWRVRQGTNPTVTLVDTVGRYDTIELVVNAFGSFFGVLAFPAPLIPLSGGAALASYSAGRGDNQTLHIVTHRNLMGNVLTFFVGAATHDGRIYSVIGVKNPGNATPEIQVETDQITVAEGGTETFRIRLTELPSEDATITASTSSSAISISPSSMIFDATNWNFYQDFIVTGLQDVGGDDEIAVIDIAGTGGGLSDTASIAVTVT